MLNKIIPSKQMIIPTLILIAAALYIYNKVPKVAAVLGNPSKGA